MTTTEPVEITVLTLPDCPNVTLVEQRIAEAATPRTVTINRVEVADQSQAGRLGMAGSPTILINGIDPFASPGTPASISCRLYRTANGTIEGAPTIADLRRALTIAEDRWTNRHRPTRLPS